MSEIIYRKLKKEDYKQVQEIINQSFGLYRYVDNPNVTYKLNERDVDSCFLYLLTSSLAYIKLK